MMPTVSVDISTSGDNTILSAATGFRYRVRRVIIRAAATVTARFKSGANNMSGAIPFAANQELLLDEAFADQSPWMTTNTSEALIINLGGAVAVTGVIVYDKQPQT